MSYEPVTVYAAEAATLANLLDSADLTLPVPTCPGWSVADLGRHTGGVHGWATESLGNDPGTPPGPEPTGPEQDAMVAGWYRARAADLLTALTATDPAQPCWTFDRNDRTAGFWHRRQAHETTLHRWDAETALGQHARIDLDVALDGIAEVLELFLPRQVRLTRITGTDHVVHLTPTETGTPQPVGTGELTGDPVGEVAGPAEALLLLLWRRVTTDDPRLTVSGDRAAVTTCLDRPLTP